MTETLVAHVLDYEWGLFIQVRGAGPAPCQSAPDSFRAIRGSLFALWTDEMLAAYLETLERAVAQGRNPLAEKYARMDGLIPPLSDNPLIPTIVAIEERWQGELQARFPALYRRCCRSRAPTGDGREFSVYLHCELETYGERTVQLYYENVARADAAGRNLAIDALDRLVAQSGYADLEQAERVLAGQASG
ncbi:DUF4125 family protein [Aromatoleum aromaticum]|uniref:DUF4125 domain-containing protein n=1 Tax=Aromatoleum aromaticum (strain DSM 19018 / LMG 30748 / EbN1) TaxID=76114 RepID=Q5P698_AROAE|nr:DUF4125 family protein [Aromatoleum aromaticum]NMG54887.1 DUF4125 family protein [Aromatoleum aromaticum]CAI07163.1 hypothetical protein c2A197 [Aromatoleum aromaticum EbN1]